MSSPSPDFGSGSGTGPCLALNLRSFLYIDVFTPEHTQVVSQNHSEASMAHSNDISIARAMFITALVVQESTAPDISRDDATLFAKTLLKTCNICTTSNIKVC